MHWHADDENRPGSGADASHNQTDRSHSQTEESRGQVDALDASNAAVTVIVIHRTGAGMYLSTGDVKCAIDKTDGIGSHMDTSSGHRDALNASDHTETGSISHGDSTDMYLGATGMKRDINETDSLGGHVNVSNGHTDAQSIQTDMLMPANAPETISIHPLELKTPNSHPGSTRERAEHPNGLRNCVDTTSGPMDVQSVAHKMEMAANTSKTVSTRPNIPKPPNSPSGDAKCDVDEMDGLGGHTDTLNGQADTPSIDVDVIRSANKSKHIRMPPNGLKMANSPMEAASQSLDKPNGCRDQTDRSSARMGSQSIGNDAKMAGNISKNVRTCQIDPKTRNLPHTPENGTPKHSYQWRKVSIDDADVYTPLNMPIDTPSQIFIFGQVEGGDKVMVARDVKQRAGNGNGDRDRDNVTSAPKYTA